MPNLGDYLGHLLSEITMARMQADLEAVRVAELYAGHPLLRNMPVPHFRVPEIDLDVPVVIKSVEEPRPGESARGGAPVADLRKTFADVFNKITKDKGVRMKAEQRKKIETELETRIGEMSVPRETSVDVNESPTTL